MLILYVLAGGVQSAFQLLREYEVQLKSIVRKRFDEAVELKNAEDISRFSTFLTHILFLKVIYSFSPSLSL